MLSNTPRVALFADTFHEVNGAANVIRRLTAFARENDFPFLSIRSGGETRFDRDGSVDVLELKRHKYSFPIDGELKFDPLLWRHKKFVWQRLTEFKPDVLHVTGLNDISQLGFYFAHFKNISTVASWHTNTHEYTARRMLCAMRWLPQRAQNLISKSVEGAIMCGIMKVHFLAQLQLAPNLELVEQLERRTRRPSFLMSRGVDTKFFSPEKRRRSSSDSTFVIGYVGRLRPEKNVRFFGEIERALRASGIENYKFVFVGEGSEDEWLRKNLKNVELTGVLRGEALAQTYADMDLFAFPSRTDAFGNVVLEAMASGVPAVVMPDGGPKYLIEHGHSGYAATDEEDFLSGVVELAKHSTCRLREMKSSARQAALDRSWERVFEEVYKKYQMATTLSKKVRVS